MLSHFRVAHYTTVNEHYTGLLIQSYSYVVLSELYWRECSLRSRRRPPAGRAAVRVGRSGSTRLIVNIDARLTSTEQRLLLPTTPIQ